MSEFRRDIRRFVDYHNKIPSDFELSLEAGDVDDDGDIIRGQYGAIDTFCIGMPMYDLLGRMVGRLELTLFNALNYTTRTEENIEIPVEKWRIKDYKGPRQKVLTYYQAKEKGLLDKGDEE